MSASSPTEITASSLPPPFQFIPSTVASFRSFLFPRCRHFRYPAASFRWFVPESTAIGYPHRSSRHRFPVKFACRHPRRLSHHKVQFFSPSTRWWGTFGVAGDGLRIYRSGHADLVAKLVPAQISTSPTASATASRRPSDANIITSTGAAGSGNSRNSPAPITSFDWNRVDPNLLVTSSYDTTCAVWNLDVSQDVIIWEQDLCIYRFDLYTLSFCNLDRVGKNSTNRAWQGSLRRRLQSQILRHFRFSRRWRFHPSLSTPAPRSFHNPLRDRWRSAAPSASLEPSW